MVAVSIGHPDDMTIRAVRILSEVGLIASEDPTMTQQLLLHHGIQATVTSYGPRNIDEKVAVLVHRLQRGLDVALVTDCGSPLVADPGHYLVAAAHAHGIPVIPVPGPSAVIAALTIAGYPCESFYFVGHLPNASLQIARRLTDSLGQDGPTVAFSTATGIARVLKILEDLSPRCPVVVAYDLTKPTEHIIRGAVCEVRERLRPGQRQEVTLVLSGKGRMTSDVRGARRTQSLSSRRIKTR